MAWAVILTAVICPGLGVQTLKQLWGRVRFVHLRPDLSDYTPFYIPAGVGAGESFPSGHVAMALVCVPIPIHLRRIERRRAAWLAWLLVILYGFGVAWGRVVWGKHYLTDVVFSFGLGLVGGPMVLHCCAARCSHDGDGRPPLVDR